MTQSIEIIDLLGKAKADMNASNAAYTPLIYAVGQQNKDIVQALLDAGADPNAKTSSGQTPVQQALDNKEIFGMLLNAKADPNSSTSYGTTVLIEAVQNSNLDAINSLLEAGANPSLTDTRGSTPISVAENNFKSDIVELLNKHQVKTDT